MPVTEEDAHEGAGPMTGVERRLSEISQALTGLNTSLGGMKDDLQEHLRDDGVTLSGINASIATLSANYEHLRDDHNDLKGSVNEFFKEYRENQGNWRSYMGSKLGDPGEAKAPMLNGPLTRLMYGIFGACVAISGLVAGAIAYFTRSH